MRKRKGEIPPSVTSVEEAVRDIARGKMVILIDDADQENEGALAMAAEKVTPETINFMARDGRGIICLTLTEERMRELAIAPQPAESASGYSSACGVMVDARKGTTTGISAADRAVTIKTVCDPRCKPEDLVRPGHVPPLCAKRGGVLARTGPTEGSVDLSRLAGLQPVGVICGIMKDDGEMARLPDLKSFARKTGLKIVTIADLVQYRIQKELLVRRFTEAPLPTRHGEFRAIVYENDLDRHHHVALVRGLEGRAFGPEERVLVRMALRMPDGGRVRILQVRLRRAARLGAQADHGGRAGCPRLPQAGGAGDRPREQDPGLRAPGSGARHRGG
jgi:3,4-dihydroxy 2-butanone 4-phosphate synthase/GTP cyclohydrolase II